MVEFAIVSPLLFLFLFAIIEGGRLIMVKQVMTNAAREGARRGVLEHTTVADVKTTVKNYLANNTITISPDDIVVSPTDLTTVGFGDPVTVTVSVPADRVSWLPASRFSSAMTLSAQSVMCGERPE